MGRGGFGYILAAFTAFLWSIAPAPATAAAFPAGSECHANVGADRHYESLADSPALWTCGDSQWSIDKPRAILRFDLRDTGRGVASRFTTRMSQFASMRIIAIGVDGSHAERTVTRDDMVPETGDWLMSADLPRLKVAPAVIAVEIDEPQHRGLLSEATIGYGPGDSPQSLRFELLVAFVCGILCVPLVFNFVFYRVLRERFLFWHAAAVTCMLVQTLVTSGIVNRFLDLSIGALILISPLSWGGGVLAAALFSADLIERGKIDSHHRLALRLVGPWILFWALYYPLASGPLRASASTFYFASFIPVLAVFVWTMGVAWWRGSRAVKFQVMAWLPIVATGLVRITTTIWSGAAPLELQFQQHVAIALEVIITSLSVADRFMMIRTQRDRARELARRFEDMAERDPLTGLLNRRAIEERYASLHEMGYRCMAVIDLDRFKAINDAHGHTIGDDVLRAAADALAPDDDTLAVRMGGEEFLLLLRGDDAAFRAERRRQAVPGRVANAVPGLDCLVTASMGLVEYDSGHAMAENFASAYAHCDRLLYEAKHNGRNRTMSAFVRHFVGNPRKLRSAGRALNRA